MVISCSAYGCTNRQTGKDKTSSFHRFPFGRPELLMRWKLAVRRLGWEPTRYSFLCSKHFRDEDYCPKKTPTSIRRLKFNAVPTIFSFTKDLTDVKKTRPPVTASQLKVNKTKLPFSSTLLIEDSVKICKSVNCKRKIVSHDHGYTLSPKDIKVNVLHYIVKKLRLKYQKMRLKRNKGKKIHRLKFEIRHLRKNFMKLPKLQEILYTNFAQKVLKILKNRQRKYSNKPLVVKL